MPEPDASGAGETSNVLIDAVLHVVRFYGEDGRPRIHVHSEGSVPVDTALGMLHLAGDIIKQGSLGQEET